MVSPLTARRARPILTLLALFQALSLTVGAAGCFYDSRWGEAKRAQQRNVVREAPAALHGDPSSARGSVNGEQVGAASRALRMRVYVTPAYATETVAWQAQIRELTDDANRVLGPAIGAHLEVLSTTPWTPPAGEENLERVLDALKMNDDAEGVDVVAAMIGGLSRSTPSFHDVGMASLVGKHLVVRAAGRADEHDAINQAFDELSDEARARLRKDLRRHRAAAVLLHEIGHTLGAMHETDRSSLMFPQYARGEEGFSAEGAGIMKIALAHRAEPPAPGEPRAWATDLRAFIVGAPAAAWVSEERAEMMARLDAVLADPAVLAAAAPPIGAAGATPLPPAPPEALVAMSPSSSATHAASSTSNAAGGEIAGVRPDDQTRYRESAAALDRGDVDAAWRVGSPLFNAYPTTYVVQDLRCKLAMKKFDWTRARAECDVLMRLSIPARKR